MTNTTHNLNDQGHLILDWRSPERELGAPVLLRVGEGGHVVSVAPGLPLTIRWIRWLRGVG
jgi:hypothetical protein